MMRFLKLSLAAAVLAACTPSVPGPPEPDDVGPFSVILFIGDGAGVAQWSAARMALPELSVDAFGVAGLVGTAATDSRVTDSAAGATAFAAGIKTYNGAIGVGPDTAAVETILERAVARGKTTGLVATSAITHATPAAFAAHVPSRYLDFEIAAQLAEADVDVMLGGGRSHFDPSERPDERDLLAELAERYTVADSTPALLALDLTEVDRLVGFTADGAPPPITRDRSPTLAELTEMALQVLERDDDGFFLMVEGSQIDWRGHDNAPLNEVVAELYDLNGAIQAGVEFQERRPNTLIVVVADHETGGMALHYDENGAFGAHYTTTGHTATMVPLFATGPGAAAMGGIKENDEIGRILMALIEDDGRTPSP